MDALTDLAIVIPVLADVEALESLLGAISTWPQRPAEIIVVAAGPSAQLAGVAAAHGARLLTYHANRDHANRGAQLDHGARHAHARILWFLHADVDVPADAPAAIEAAVERGAESGCLRFDFQGPPTWYKRGIAALTALRIRCGGIAYGDQGIFALREIYLAVGGFPHEPLFEEVQLVRRLKMRGTFRMLATPIAVSTRRWDRDGWWRRSWHNRWLAVCFALGVPAQRLAGAYQRQRLASERPEN
jgi:rSAM/selenodomain-associated transferase 2